MRGRAVVAVLLTALAASPGLAGGAEILAFSDLDGWAEDDHAAAFTVFLEGCPDLKDADWSAICGLAAGNPDPRRFFELLFRPVRLGGPGPALFTGYYEPELRASARRTGLFRYPVYALPPEATPGEPWLTRAEIEQGGALDDRDIEIAWLRDPVDVYLLQLQGSGRLRMTDGRVVRVGYAGRNGHARQPIATELLRRGAFDEHQVSLRTIRNWVRNNPEEGRALLHSDPSYVFFRVVEDHPPEAGPLGAIARPLVKGRSIAVDPAHVPLGAPVWIEKAGEVPMHRLMVAQDTGGAIKGPQRADIFFGTGADAEADARVIRDAGQIVVLLPIDHAYTLAAGL